MTDTIPEAAVAGAARSLGDVLASAIELDADAAALVVFDAGCELARALAAAYRRCLPEATFVDFDATAKTSILAGFDILERGDLVVLIQSTSFRLDAFRIRIELFNRGLKVIEHPHLARMGGAEAEVYLASLAYDPGYYRGVGHALRRRIDASATGLVESAPGPDALAQLHFPAGFEPAKVNIGDYRELKNVGGQFPIGEVFTESRELEAVHGEVAIGFFGDTDFTVNRPPRPITLVVEGGQVVATRDSTPEFEGVLDAIRAHEGQVWIRELGFGLNRAFNETRTVSDIGTFERMCGIHLSLGSKHATYNKPEIRKRAARYHVDVFARTVTVRLDRDVVYANGRWTIEPIALEA